MKDRASLKEQSKARSSAGMRGKDELRGRTKVTGGGASVTGS